ncbi:MAG: DNA-3-methyladenine glycosylase I, partial [Thermomicrobiales bacterium]
FTGGGVLDRPGPVAVGDIPATTPESDAMSKALKKLGFTFVGSTIIYAFMQSAGMVNDHVLTCPARERCIAAAASKPR